jgi:hypothetical protein
MTMTRLIDKLIAGVAKIESWVRLVWVACLSFLEIVRRHAAFEHLQRIVYANCVAAALSNNLRSLSECGFKPPRKLLSLVTSCIWGGVAAARGWKICVGIRAHAWAKNIIGFGI